MSEPRRWQLAHDDNVRRFGGGTQWDTPSIEMDDQVAWFIPYGPRPVVVTFTDPETGAIQGTERWHHGLILRLMSDLIDHLRKFDPDNKKDLALAEAMFELVENDLQTGVSIRAWPTMNVLVDQVLTEATNIEDHVSDLRTEWEEF